MAKVLSGDTSGVCYNCLNGFHQGCDHNNCKCEEKKHVAWWWKDEPSFIAGASSQKQEIEQNISVEMMRTEGDIKEWERLRELFSQKTSVPKSERGLRSLNCFIEGYNAAKEELESKEESPRLETDAVEFANFIRDNYSPTENNEGWMKNGRDYKKGDIPDCNIYQTIDLYRMFVAESKSSPTP